MLLFSAISRRVDKYKKKTSDKIQNVKDASIRLGITSLVAAVIIWVAIFLYVAFYYAYMPSLSHGRPVHLQFKSCDDKSGMCSFPSAHVQLTRKQQLLMVGQSYKMYLQLEMPESPRNQQLGMFMACMHLRDKSGYLVDNSCRSSMLHYRSQLLGTLQTLVYIPMYLFGSKEEKQTLTLEMFSDFEEDPNHPVTDIYVEIQNKHIELYSATLHVNAHFTGLRYLMFHWPLLSAGVGISSNLFFIVLIFSLSWYHLTKSELDSDYEFDNGNEREVAENTNDTQFKGEPDDSSFEDASFMDDNSKESDQSSNGTDAQDESKLLKSGSFQLLHSSSIEVIGN